MAEKTSGIYRLVTIPAAYEAFQNLLGGKRAREAFGRDHFPPLVGRRVLEVGCGPATWFPQLRAASEYVGIDWNAEHIEKATAQYGSPSAHFVCGDVAADIGLPEASFDHVFAFGLLHHLDDAQSARLLESARRFLVPSGSFIAVEPVYHDGQHPFARWMKDRDSGQNIRRREGYVALLGRQFPFVKAEIFTGMLRIPYSHCLITAGLVDNG